MSSFHAGSSALSVSALASNSTNNSARTRKRKASCVARAAAGVPGCSKRYCQNVTAHWRPGYFSSVSLLPALRNCSASSRACLLSVLMRSNSASGAVVLFSCARAAAQPSSIKPRLSSKRRCFIFISSELKKLFHQEVKTARSELAVEGERSFHVTASNGWDNCHKHGESHRALRRGRCFLMTNVWHVPIEFYAASVI